MFIALSITILYVIFVWLVFFKFKWLRFNIGWGIVSFWVGAHILLLFLISLRFFQPYSTDGHIIHHTIQLVPRLPQPTILTEVLVEANTPIKKDQPLFQFDRTLYQAQVDQQAANLAARLEAYGKDDPLVARDQAGEIIDCRVLLSEDSASLLNGRYNLEPLGEADLRGARDKMKIFRLPTTTIIETLQGGSE